MCPPQPKTCSTVSNALKCIKSGPIPGVERPDALLLSDPEESVEHPSVAHLCVLGLTLDL